MGAAAAVVAGEEVKLEALLAKVADGREVAVRVAAKAEGTTGGEQREPVVGKMAGSVEKGAGN